MICEATKPPQQSNPFLHICFEHGDSSMHQEEMPRTLGCRTGKTRIHIPFPQIYKAAISSCKGAVATAIMCLRALCVLGSLEYGDGFHATYSHFAADQTAFISVLLLYIPTLLQSDGFHAYFNLCCSQTAFMHTPTFAAVRRLSCRSAPEGFRAQPGMRSGN